MLLQNTICKWNAVFSLNHNTYVNTALFFGQSSLKRYGRQECCSLFWRVSHAHFTSIWRLFYILFLFISSQQFTLTHIIAFCVMTPYHTWIHHTFATTVSQLEICDFSGEILKVSKCCTFVWVRRRHSRFPATSFIHNKFYQQYDNSIRLTTL